MHCRRVRMGAIFLTHLKMEWVQERLIDRSGYRCWGWFLESRSLRSTFWLYREPAFAPEGPPIRFRETLRLLQAQTLVA